MGEKGVGKLSRETPPPREGEPMGAATKPSDVFSAILLVTKLSDVFSAILLVCNELYFVPRRSWAF